jgi:hypothetical protein
MPAVCFNTFSSGPLLKPVRSFTYIATMRDRRASSFCRATPLVLLPDALGNHQISPTRGGAFLFAIVVSTLTGSTFQRKAISLVRSS